MSQVTTHILDIAGGLPAQGITVILYAGENDSWNELSRAISNQDGRVAGLMKDKSTLQAGIYKLRFETKDYFDSRQIPTFYPFIEISFDLRDAQHYHVPLLLSPFGYSTYRGS